MAVRDGGPRHARQVDVVGMVVMLLLAAILCAIGAMQPPTPASPATLNGVLAVVAAALAAAVWLLPDHRWLLHLATATYLLGNGVLISQAARGEGAATAALSYIWLAMYAAVVFGRGLARMYAVAAAVCMAAALWSNPVIAAPFHTWVVVASTLVVAIELLADMVGRLRRRAVTDGLTGLPTRAALEIMFSHERSVAGRNSSPLSLALLDLDDFKQVNDASGHAAGDALLTDLVTEWRDRLRAQDALFRYGGDEFVVMLPDTAHADATALLAKLRSSSCGRWSFGVSSLEDGANLDSMLRCADERMYADKQRSRDTPLTCPSQTMVAT